MKTNSRIQIKPTLIEDVQYFKLVDNYNNSLSQSRIKRLIARYNSCFYDFDNLILKNDLNYYILEQFIDNLNNTLSRIDEKDIVVNDEIKEYISQNKYAIEEQRIAGVTIKSYDKRWEQDVIEFNNIINDEITRPLLKQQIQASFFLAKMKKAANFSVPGAGKTAMMYGTFAYLSSKEINAINKILVVCPINAFEAWRSEFNLVFGNKRKLKYLNLRDKKYNDSGMVKLDWGISNVIVTNYESLGNKVKLLNELIDDRVMIVFDEVHRVKGIGGKRAKHALELGNSAQYHYVLTGTPIPNSYKDIYNFLHLLYRNEYESYFGWEVNYLEKPNSIIVNDKLQPFFWRTNKKDLNVPIADDDKVILVKPTVEQTNLAEAIYENESNILAIYIRLLQASSNPELLLEKIDYYDLGVLDYEFDLTQYNAINDEEKEEARINAYKKLNINCMQSDKFNKGIELVVDLVAQGKKVLVWGMFVGTMTKIVRELAKRGVSANLVYGRTPKDNREGIINEFRYGNVEVLVSNPNTLGEAISLHQTVHDAVYFEYNFNLTFMLQSRDRIHRLGLSADQYTRYYYLMTSGDRAHNGFIDTMVYKRLKEKEDIMLKAIEGDMLVPVITDDYLEEVKKIIKL